MLSPRSFGDTWSTPANLSTLMPGGAPYAPPVPKGTNWTTFGTFFADSAGIQTSTGRLVVPGFVEVCFNNPRGTCNKTLAPAFKPNGGKGGQTPVNWGEMTYLLVSDDGGSSWQMTEIFGLYSGEAEVVQLFNPPTRLGCTMRLDGPMTDHCPGNRSTCTTGYGEGATMQCGRPSNPSWPAPHHCRGWMVSDTDGETWYNPLAATKATATTALHPSWPAPVRTRQQCQHSSFHCLSSLQRRRRFSLYLPHDGYRLDARSSPAGPGPSRSGLQGRGGAVGDSRQAGCGQRPG